MNCTRALPAGLTGFLPALKGHPVNPLTALLSLFVPKLNLPPAVGEPQWLGQHTASAERLHRRALVRKYGRRQALKHIKLGRRLASA